MVIKYKTRDNNNNNNNNNNNDPKLLFIALQYRGKEALGTRLDEFMRKIFRLFPL